MFEDVPNAEDAKRMIREFKDLLLGNMSTKLYEASLEAKKVFWVKKPKDGHQKVSFCPD